MAKRVLPESSGVGSSKRATISSHGGLFLHNLPQVETKYPPASDKVCIVCNFSRGSAYQYGIFFVDIKLCEVQNKVYPALEPSIVLDHSFPRHMAFALWKNRLFMFGGHVIDCLAKTLVYESSVFAYDITSTPTAIRTNLRKDSVAVLPNMKGGKICLFAAIVGAKICVFSYLITKPEIAAFELFDPVTEVCAALPQIPDAYSPDLSLIGGLEVEAYSVQENNLFISTGKKNIYLINVETPSESEFVWIRVAVEWMDKPPSMDSSHVPPHSNDPSPPLSVGFRFAGGSLMLEDLCFNPLVAVFMRPYMGCPIPLFFLTSDGLRRRDDPLIYSKRLETCIIRGDCSLVCLGERRLCTAKVGLKGSSVGLEDLEDGLSCPYLLLDAFNFKSLSPSENKTQNALKFDFDFGEQSDVQDDYAERLEITALTSSKYELTGNKCQSVSIVGFFAM